MAFLPSLGKLVWPGHRRSPQRQLGLSEVLACLNLAGGSVDAQLEVDRLEKSEPRRRRDRDRRSKPVRSHGLELAADENTIKLEWLLNAFRAVGPGQLGLRRCERTSTEYVTRIPAWIA